MFSWAAFEQLVVLALLVVLGLGLRKGKVLDDRFLAQLNRLLVLVAQPALMIQSTQQDLGEGALGNFAIAALISTVGMFAIMGIMYLLTRKKERKAYAVLCDTAALPNLGYMGIPVTQAILGKESTFYMCAAIVGMNISMWTLGTALYGKTQRGEKKRTFNPILPALALGIAFMVMGVKLPQGIRGALDQLSGLNTPLALLILGARMESLRPAHFKDGSMWLSVIFKLLVFPLGTYALLRLTNLPGLLVHTLTLGLAMPSAANIQVQAEMSHGDGELAARCISVSLLLSMITIPLIVTVIG